METLKDKIQIARKECHCEYCGRKIEKGQKYHYSFTVDGGDNWVIKSCIYCNNIVSHLFTKEEQYMGIEILDISDRIFYNAVE